MSLGVGRFDDGKEAVYITRDSNGRLTNFFSLDGLKSRIAEAGEDFYDLRLINYSPTVNPLSPDEKAYITKK